MVFHDKDGNVTAVYPHGSEEYQRLERVLEILLKADLLTLERLNEKKSKKEQEIDSQIKESDKRIFRKCLKRSAKRYNITQAARILGVHRETIYYWIKKGWVKPGRDYRNYPVFTVLDIERLIEWRNTIHCNDETN